MSCRHTSCVESLTFQNCSVRLLLSSLCCLFCRWGNQKVKEVKWFAQGYPGIKWQSWRRAQGPPGLKSHILSTSPPPCFPFQGVCQDPLPEMLTANASDSGMNRKSLGGPGGMWKWLPMRYGFVGLGWAVREAAWFLTWLFFSGCPGGVINSGRVRKRERG